MVSQFSKLPRPQGNSLPAPIMQFRKLDALLDANKDTARILSKIKGADFIGKDEFGRAILTRPPEALKMDVGERVLGVVIEFKNDGSAPRQAIPQEIRIDSYTGRKGGSVLRGKTDVLKAVRALKRLREWHENEPNLNKGNRAENAAYFLLRECSLRATRDYMLEIVIGNWIADLKRFGNFRVKDWQNDFCNYKRIAGALEFSREMEGLGSIAENSGKRELYSYSENKAIWQIAATIENLETLRNNRSAEMAKERLVNAGRLLKARQLKPAGRQLFEASESIGRSKPWWVAMELEKTRDNYTSLICEGLNRATSILFDNRNIPQSIGIFQHIAGKLRELKQLGG